MEILILIGYLVGFVVVFFTRLYYNYKVCSDYNSTFLNYVELWIWSLIEGFAWVIFIPSLVIHKVMLKLTRQYHN